MLHKIKTIKVISDGPEVIITSKMTRVKEPPDGLKVNAKPDDPKMHVMQDFPEVNVISVDKNECITRNFTSESHVPKMKRMEEPPEANIDLNV